MGTKGMGWSDHGSSSGLMNELSEEQVEVEGDPYCYRKYSKNVDPEEDCSGFPSTAPKIGNSTCDIIRANNQTPIRSHSVWMSPLALESNAWTFKDTLEIFWVFWTLFSPERTDVGIVCCRSKTNRNILSPRGRKPSLSARVTMPRPVGGTNTRRPKIIAAVVLSPSFELPGPKNSTETKHSKQMPREKELPAFYY